MAQSAVTGKETEEAAKEFGGKETKKLKETVKIFGDVQRSIGIELESKEREKLNQNGNQ